MWDGENRLPRRIQAALPSLPQPCGAWAVYLLLCDNGALYCGISNRPQQRWQAHVCGRGARYTRMYAPVAMRLLQVRLDKGVAARCENRIKRLSAADKQWLWQVLPAAEENGSI